MEFIHYFKNKLNHQIKKSKQKKKKNTAYLTMMVIPHCRGAVVKNFRFPLWFVKISAVVGVTGVLSLVYFVSGYFYLQYTAAENKELRQINTVQAVEIQELKGLTGEMKNKLEALLQIDSEVRAKVGLSKPKAEDVLKDLQTSRALGSYALLTMGLADRQTAAANTVLRRTAMQPRESSLPVKGSDSLEELKVELTEMDRLLTEQAETMDKLKFDVEKQLALQRAKPEAWPLRGVITSDFGWRKNPFDHSSEEYHQGVDIGGSYGAPIRAAGNGVVILADYHASWGNVVLISHGFGYVSQYGHNASLLVQKGDKVEREQIIARLGSTGRATGAHLHFGVAKNGEWIDPLTVLK
jgi:murein DD-endopeptidase MepM/ murein hydrolase activator NlpD